MACTPKPIRQKGRRIFNHFQREDRNHPDYDPKISPRTKLNRYKRTARFAQSLRMWDESYLPHVNWKRTKKLYGV